MKLGSFGGPCHFCPTENTSCIPLSRRDNLSPLKLLTTQLKGDRNGDRLANMATRKPDNILLIKGFYADNK